MKISPQSFEQIQINDGFPIGYWTGFCIVREINEEPNFTTDHSETLHWSNNTSFDHFRFT